MMKIVEGRIIKGIGGLYTVAAGDEVIECNVRGIFRKEKITPMVGDYVEAETSEGKARKGTINKIKRRKNELIRPKVSNIDHAVIVFSIKSPELNIDMLDRFIVLSEEKGLPITICINKIDLCGDFEYKELKRKYEKIGYNVICASAVEKVGLEALTDELTDKVSVLAGPSGAGKSSIINAVIPSLSLKTGGLSLKIERGKHTTRHSELIRLFDNTYIIDSPGFTSITLAHIGKEGLPYLFKEFRPFLGMCKFSDCAHIKETGCVIKENVGSHIDEGRYVRFVKFSEELTGFDRR